MRPDLFKKALSRLKDRSEPQAHQLQDSFTPIKKLNNQNVTYSHRFRGQWFKPEWDFNQIAIADNGGDSYIGRANLRKVNKLISAGFSFIGASDEPVKYIKRRIKEMEFATGTPFLSQIAATIKDVSRYNNCMWAKVRSAEYSTGAARMDVNGQKVNPVAGYYILPFETLQLKHKRNSNIKKVLVRLPDGEEKEFSAKDVVHFYTNRSPGFAVGTPELWPALDDAQLLRRIEENVEELIDTNLFPVFQWKVGTDAMPEKVDPSGRPETDIVKQTVQYTPASGLYVTDHRHEISAVGSEGRALRIDYYLSYFKNRLFTALGTSSVDMGEGDSSNRSTASTMSKGMLMDIEAMAKQIEEFINLYVIAELLVEGGYDPLDEQDEVRFKFGVIDKEERRAEENHVLQTFHGHVRTMEEVRHHLGEKPWDDASTERSYFKMFQEPLSLLQGMGPGTAASETLSKLNVSNLTPEAVNKEKQHAEKLEKAKARPGPNASTSTGSNRAAAARSHPSNQHGTRSTTKTTRDLTNQRSISFNDINIEVDASIQDSKIDSWKQYVLSRHKEMPEIDLETLANNLKWRLE